MKFLHAMIRVKDVQKSLDNYTEKSDLACERKIAEIMEV